MHSIKHVRMKIHEAEIEQIFYKALCFEISKVLDVLPRLLLSAVSKVRRSKSAGLSVCCFKYL